MTRAHAFAALYAAVLVAVSLVTLGDMGGIVGIIAALTVLSAAPWGER